jgi:hypothetical protein
VNRILFALLLALCEFSIHGQGKVEFANRLANVFAARVTFLDGTGVGAGYTAQLFGGTEGTAVGSLRPLYPTATFKTFNSVVLGYFDAGNVVVPNVGAGQNATLVVRVYEGPNWENSICRGESFPIIVELSGGALPPVYLEGLQPFQVNCVPEPNTMALICFAACISWGRLLLSRRRRRKSLCVL